MEIDTKLSIAGTNIVTDKETALLLYDALAKSLLFSEYSSDMLEPIVEHNLTMSPLPKGFLDDVNAAQTVGDTYGQYVRNKGN